MTSNLPIMSLSLRAKSSDDVSKSFEPELVLVKSTLAKEVERWSRGMLSHYTCLSTGSSYNTEESLIAPSPFVPSRLPLMMRTRLARYLLRLERVLHPRLSRELLPFALLSLRKADAAHASGEGRLAKVSFCVKS